MGTRHITTILLTSYMIMFWILKKSYYIYIYMYIYIYILGEARDNKVEFEPHMWSTMNNTLLLLLEPWNTTLNLVSSFYTYKNDHII